MYEDKVKALLEQVKNGEVDTELAFSELKDLPFEDLEYANIDHHREIRNGFPEVIYCQGKRLEHIRGIIERMIPKGNNILATRANKEIYEYVKDLHEQIIFNEASGTIIVKQEAFGTTKHKVLVVTGGTSDVPVAEEAVETAMALGVSVEKLYDVGVAGIHRLLSRMEILKEASVIIAVAGMEGALPSVVGGLVDVPVIAVPTSVGYGSHFNGLASLLAMLNSCASGIGVVNIDNGFGAAYLASTMIRQMEKAGGYLNE